MRVLNKTEQKEFNKELFVVALNMFGFLAGLFCIGSVFFFKMITPLNEIVPLFGAVLCLVCTIQLIRRAYWWLS